MCQTAACYTEERNRKMVPALTEPGPGNGDVMHDEYLLTDGDKLTEQVLGGVT